MIVIVAVAVVAAAGGVLGTQASKDDSTAADTSTSTTEADSTWTSLTATGSTSAPSSSTAPASDPPFSSSQVLPEEVVGLAPEGFIPTGVVDFRFGTQLVRLGGPPDAVIDAFGQPISTEPEEMYPEDSVQQWDLPGGASLSLIVTPDRRVMFISVEVPEGATPVALPNGVALGASSVAELINAWGTPNSGDLVYGGCDGPFGVTSIIRQTPGSDDFTGPTATARVFRAFYPDAGAGETGCPAEGPSVPADSEQLPSPVPPTEVTTTTAPPPTTKWPFYDVDDAVEKLYDDLQGRFGQPIGSHHCTYGLTVETEAVGEGTYECTALDFSRFVIGTFTIDVRAASSGVATPDVTLT